MGWWQDGGHVPGEEQQDNKAKRGGHTQTAGNLGTMTRLVLFEGDMGIVSWTLLALPPPPPLLLAFSSPGCLELSLTSVVSSGLWFLQDGSTGHGQADLVLEMLVWLYHASLGPAF